MKKYCIYLSALVMASCGDFLDLQPEFQVSEDLFYKNANDFETALIGNYAGLQELHSVTLLYIGELTTDNAEIKWTTPSVAEVEADEINFTPSNTFLNAIWSDCFATISRSNNILARIDQVNLPEQQQNQYKGEALFLRAYGYFYLVRLFGEVPMVEVAFRSPNEIMNFDMSRKPTEQIYTLIKNDLTEAAHLLAGASGLSKSRASSGAANTLLGKVHLTLGEFEQAATVLKEVVDSGVYSLETDYGRLFTNGNDELAESVFEIKYLSGNVGEGNSFSSTFTPARFDMAIFPNNMQGSGRILPTPEMAGTYEPDDLRRHISIGDSVLLVTGNYEKELYGLKFVDFSVGVLNDGGINFTALRYADVLLMYAEALNGMGYGDEAHTYLNLVRNRAGLDDLEGLSQQEFALAMEQERKVEFFLEGHRWFDLVRTGRLQLVVNRYFMDKGLSFSVEEHEWIMPIPLREIDIDQNLEQNPGY